MEPQEYDAFFCPVGNTIELISGKWKPIILYLIEHNNNRFSLLKRKMPKVSKKVLTQQLREMEENNLITREVRVGKHPQVVIYSLTERGLSLRKLINMIFEWGAANLLNGEAREVVKGFIL
jgi:DNA-binding HxlR family transcriptional regulator